VRRRALWIGIAVLAVVTAAPVGLLALVDAGFFHAALVRHIESSTQRHIVVGGAMQVRLLSRRPHLIARQVTIGDPPWIGGGTFATVAVIELRGNWALFGAPFVIDLLRLEGVDARLLRDESGRANWQRYDPSIQAGRGLPVIHALDVHEAHVTLDDARRHLQFSGKLTVGAAQAQGGSGLQIDAAGTLNGRPATYRLSGDPLAQVQADQPYHFTFAGDSSGSQLRGNGAIPLPFDFRKLQVAFHGSGGNLLDVYYLTGLKLAATGPYQWSGKIALGGTRTTFSELAVTSGDSDLGGTVVADNVDGRGQLDATLTSRHLRTADLGTRVAAAQPAQVALPEQDTQRVFSERRFDTAALARNDTRLSWKADDAEVGKLALLQVAAKLSIERGVVNVQLLNADLSGGKIHGSLKMNATGKQPLVSIDAHLANVRTAYAIEAP
jgi:uncharacterized protein involved in outer membrane biogenesis